MHNNISFFIPLMGCRYRCSFCDQREISGQSKMPTFEEIKNTCKEQLSLIKDPKDTEIAFFGGTFTALPRDLMVGFLECVQDFIDDDKFFGIRLSTRPDAIDEEIISILKKYHVTSVELGAQSMSDKVLTANGRGHSAEDVEKAFSLLKKAGFETGLQMMTGLYKSTPEDDIYTVKKIARMHPDTVRIYPTVVIGSTDLGKLYKAGKYEMVSFDTMADLVGWALEYFESCGIKVIKCGLHAEKTLERDIVAGYYHPAFREIAEGTIYRRKVEKIIRENKNPKYILIYVNKGQISCATGQRRANKLYFKSCGTDVKFLESNKVHEKYWCGTEN